MPQRAPVKGRIIVSGILFTYPLGGVIFQFLHYLVGLRRLGYDPYYVEDTGRWLYDPQLNTPTPDPSGSIRAVLPSLEAHGFADRWAFRSQCMDGRCYGMPEDRVRRLYREADAFLNVTGGQHVTEDVLACPRRVYVQSDPFAAQVLAAQGHGVTQETLDAHDTLFTFGENVGAPDCDVPLDYRWLPTRQPVVVDLWGDPGSVPESAAYRTITSWHSRGKEVVHKGETYYWTKDREFERFLDLPRRVRVPLELATDPDERVQVLLGEHGWRTENALTVSATADGYRRYIQGSHGEFTVARDQYVRPHTGWFSDRSACYLAAGRPVITQETGFSKFLPTGKGLFGFETADDVAAAVETIEADYEGNCRAAREIAAEYFAAEKVLGSLVERARL